MGQQPCGLRTFDFDAYVTSLALAPFVQVLYNLFEWPLREGSRLAVIGISNTHDLDSRVLPRIARWAP